MERFEIATSAESIKVILELHENHSLPFDVTICALEGSSLLLLVLEYKEKDEKVIDWVLERAGIKEADS